MAEAVQVSGPDLVSCYFRGLEDCRVIETHVSKVFLTPNRAYKLKKPVLFPYLDYSTLEKREHYCRREVQLNRRTAPQIYRGVKAVCKGHDGAIFLADTAKGEILDWVVEMTRFDDNQLLGLVVQRQKLKRPLLETIAQTIATFHRGAEIRIDKGGYGGLSFICGNNAECFERFAEGIFDPRLITELNQKTRAQVERLRDLLEQRREQGYVRQCHGDMHLRNIFLEDGKPVLFDGIEFNDDIACIDTLYDLAFLLMDLDERELHREANILFNRYMDIIGDVSGLAALPLMLSLRAAIRAHVGAAALHNSGKLKDDALVEPRLYLDNALRHLDRPPPRLIAIGGLSGSGKSRLAREIAPLVYAPPGALVLRSDAIRKRLSGASMLERLGPEGYTPEKSVQTYETLYNDAQRALEAGHTVIADAVFSKPEERTAIEAVAQKSGLPFNGLWVSASPEIMAERIAKRKGNVSDATVEVLQQQLNYDLGTVSWNKVDSSGPGKATVTSAMTILRT